MLEVMIERWSALDGSVDYRWSLWRDGRRIQMGGPHGDPGQSEQAAREYCTDSLGSAPDRVTHL
jgi:hypothetical protein